jgi:hypothetical protein
MLEYNILDNILNLVVCILLRVLDQVQGFPYENLQVVRPKHVADNLNKVVNNYWNSVVLDGNPRTWY